MAHDCNLLQLCNRIKFYINIIVDQSLLSLKVNIRYINTIVYTIALNKMIKTA